MGQCLRHEVKLAFNAAVTKKTYLFQVLALLDVRSCEGVVE